jgi:RNA polymerase sigma factor (sigma-70 family)
MRHLAIDAHFLNAIGREPLLTPTEELTLARTIQAGASPDATPRERRKAQRAKERMVRANMRLGVTLALKAHGRCKSMDFADLVQETAFGLIRAAEKFDPSRGYRFSTYAYSWIKQSLTRSVSNQDRMIRIPIHVNDGLYRYSKITEQATRDGCTVSREQAVADAKTTPHLFDSALMVLGVASLNQVQLSEGNTELGELLPAPTPEPEYGHELGLDRDVLLGLVQALPDNQRYVLQGLYGLNGQDPVTQRVLGKQLGVTRSAISEIKQRAERNLRSAIIRRGLGV